MLAEANHLESERLNEWIATPSFVSRFKKLPKKTQQSLLHILCRARLADLSIQSRGILIKAMQVGPTRERHELAIRDMLLATHGADLTRLKRHIDRTEDHRDLAELLFHDLDQQHIRQQILHHFQREARLHPSAEFRVISDVDDTVYRNWVDPRYPPRTVYPGVLQLHDELRGDVVLLTGRVGDRAGILERYYRRRLGALGIKQITMLTGTLVHQFVHPWIFSKKWANLERHYRLFPEMRMVMFGDTGQADPEFLSQAIEHYGDQVAMALLHRVRGLAEDRIERCQRNGVRFFDTYVGAATHLYRAGLISAEKLMRVSEAARADFGKIRFINDRIRQERLGELERDAREAREEAASG